MNSNSRFMVMWLFIYYLINRAKSDPVLSLPKIFIIVNHTCDQVVSLNSILTSIFPFCLGTIIVPRLMGATWTLLPAATLANSSPRSTWRKTPMCRFARLIWKNHSSTHLLNFKTIPVRVITGRESIVLGKNYTVLGFSFPRLLQFRMPTISLNIIA